MEESAHEAFLLDGLDATEVDDREADDDLVVELGSVAVLPRAGVVQLGKGQGLEAAVIAPPAARPAGRGG